MNKSMFFNYCTTKLMGMRQTTAGTNLWVATLFALDVLGCRQRQETRSQVQILAAESEAVKLDSRFCSEQKFLCGFLDLFFCLFLDRMSVVPSASSSALFWRTVLLPSEPRFCPLATGSLGLRDVSGLFLKVLVIV